MIIYSRPKNLIVPEVLTTQSLSQQRKDKHPLLVLTVNPDGAGSIIVTYISSFRCKAGAFPPYIAPALGTLDRS